ncbi:ArsR/SmtB family transcription factor [Pediococcus acidilactici]|uniref:ArsR/SmtB family transcription factor n=1 Tax=Pediococcus acidilactici TaxID=1254 RepID=UPI00194DB1EF|nr:ArsR family transcriptional regulator [Pediococcus acidilactici]MBM6585017.1 ArsR family transcriptional regulator [Pediococcus acidilactici]
MELSLDKKSLFCYKALASETRINILALICEEPRNVTELSSLMHLSKAIISRHLHTLEDALLIHYNDVYRTADGITKKKVFSLAVDFIRIEFPQKIFLPYSKKSTEIQLGYYSDFSVTPSCGIASNKSIIGKFDDPRSFVLDERTDAKLLWLSEGFVEYRIPNILEPSEKLEMLDLSLECSSEFPVSNNNWPSDISFFVNDVKVGTYTSPGNFSDVRGKLNPKWWDTKYSQYGNLIHLRINSEDTGIDGEKVSNVSIKDIGLDDSLFIKIRIAIEENAKHKGGITIFGDTFGNHPQNINLTYYYTVLFKDMPTD